MALPPDSDDHRRQNRAGRHGHAGLAACRAPGGRCPQSPSAGRAANSALYPGKLGYELQEELEFLSNRAMEPNIFFSGRFLGARHAAPRGRQVRLSR